MVRQAHHEDLVLELAEDLILELVEVRQAHHEALILKPVEGLIPEPVADLILKPVADLILSSSKDEAASRFNDRGTGFLVRPHFLRRTGFRFARKCSSDQKSRRESRGSPKR
jgi:hypothetical protein